MISEFLSGRGGSSSEFVDSRSQTAFGPRRRSASMIESPPKDSAQWHPYRQNGISNEAATSSISLSQDAERGANESKKTPFRTVFNDLPTAHSSITSGTARINYRPPSRSASNPREEDLIPLHDFKPSCLQRDTHPNLQLPLPPPPAILSDSHYKNSSYESIAAQDGYVLVQKRTDLTATRQATVEVKVTSVFDNIKNALASISSAERRNATPDIPTASHGPKSKNAGVNDSNRSSFLPGKQLALYQAGESSELRQVELSEQIGKRQLSRSSVTNSPNDFNNLFIYSTSHRAALSPLPLRNRLEVDRDTTDYPVYNRLIEDRSDLKMQNAQLALVDPYQSSSFPHQLQKHRIVSNGDGSSLPDCSTVGNIYKHYVRSEDIGDISEYEDNGSDADPSAALAYHNSHATSHGFPSSPPLQGSALCIRKQQRLERLQINPQGQAPRSVLPVPPEVPRDNAVQRITPCTSNGIGHSSSYGDTKNLLEITQRINSIRQQPGMSAAESQGDRKQDESMSDISQSMEPGVPKFKSKNPFRVNRGSKDVESSVEPHSLENGVQSHNTENKRVQVNGRMNDYLNAVNRLPLEREVSEALRRASAFSVYSNGSVSELVPDRYGSQPSEASTYVAIKSLLRGHANATSQLKSTQEEEVMAAQAKAFYDQQAIPSNWVTSRQQNVVRVPINRPSLLQISSPALKLRNVKVSFELSGQIMENDQNDWETVGESAFDRYENPAMLGGTVNRAGSSIANTSDYGSISTDVPEIDAFGSTTRIAQHPGNIQYSGDYRQRDLKKSNMPVFLPIYREHKVNGYLADSIRIRQPQTPFYNTLPRLDTQHRNPFRSPVPEFSPRIKRSPNLNHFPPSSPKSPLSENISDRTEQKIRGEEPQQRRRDSSSWMDQFGEPGPAIATTTLADPFLEGDASNRPVSWQHVMALRRGESSTGYKLNGSRLAGKRALLGASSSSGGSHFLNSDGFVEMKVYGDKSSIPKNTTQPINQNPFVKRPPGAFYQGVASQLEHRPTTRSRREPSVRKAALQNNYTREAPTNVLRPLSLLASRRPTTPLDQIMKGPNEFLEHDFVYRSPLAPPKRDSWQQLYSTEEIKRIRESAKADGFFGSRSSMGDVPQSMRKDTQMHLFKAPTLNHYSTQRSSSTHLVTKKGRISIVVLCLCATFPPLLLLYALGRLDGIMNWMTEGQCLAFGIRQKKVARLLVYLWGIAIFIGLVAFLVYWFAVLHALKSQ